MVVFRLTEWSPRIHTRFHVPGATQDFPIAASPFAYATITLCGPAFLNGSARLAVNFVGSYNPCFRRSRFGLVRFRSPLLSEYSLFLALLRCFSSGGSLEPGYVFTRPYQTQHLAGFPIRTSPDIMSNHDSPRLIAVIHVLRRQPTPRHPPCALSSLLMLRRN